MPGDRGVALRIVAAGLGIDEAGSYQEFTFRCFFDLGSLQDVVAAARRLLRIGGGLLEALDAQLEEQPVLVGERVVVERIGLVGRRRHPVVAVLGEELVPLVEALLVQQARFPDHELDGIGHGAMNSAQARNWLRMEISLVPLAVTSFPVSETSKFLCRSTQSL